MAVTRFDWDFSSMGRYLKTSAELQVAVVAFAGEISDLARTYAPVGSNGDKHPGEFRDSIHAEPAVFAGSIGAKVVADSTDALWAEFGRGEYARVAKNGRRTTFKGTKGSHALKRAAQKLNSPKRRA